MECCKNSGNVIWMNERKHCPLTSNLFSPSLGPCTQGPADNVKIWASSPATECLICPSPEMSTGAGYPSGACPWSEPQGVRPGIYTLYAWNAGVVPELASDGIIVRPGLVDIGNFTLEVPRVEGNIIASQQISSTLPNCFQGNYICICTCTFTYVSKCSPAWGEMSEGSPIGDSLKTSKCESRVSLNNRFVDWLSNI